MQREKNKQKNNEKRGTDLKRLDYALDAGGSVCPTSVLNNISGIQRLTSPCDAPQVTRGEDCDMLYTKKYPRLTCSTLGVMTASRLST